MTGYVYRIAIIGAGASGIACAARLAYLMHSAASDRLCLEEDSAHGNAFEKRLSEVEVTVFEAAHKVGRPILRSGNGRCNISNRHPDPELYHNSDFVRRVFEAAESECADEREIGASIPEASKSARDGKDGIAAPSQEAAIDEVFFANRGLLLMEESEGRLYPYPNKASAVLDVLMECISESFATDVEIVTEAKVKGIVSAEGSMTNSSWGVLLDDDTVLSFDSVVVSTGGKTGAELLSDIPSLKSSYIEPIPMLCPLKLHPKPSKPMDNIRVRCKLTLIRDGAVITSERGEVLFRRYGISGIAVFNLSRLAKESDIVSLDLTPDIDCPELADLLETRAASIRKISGGGCIPTCRDVLRGLLLPELADECLKLAGIRPDGEFGKSSSFRDMADAVKHLSFEVDGTADADRAQVHRGGISIDAVDPHTLETYGAPGLYITGEALDVDGPCGGFNLHFAWMSGLLAATAVFRDVMGR